MNRRAILLSGLLACGLTTVGCCDQYKKQLAEIQQQYNDLETSNQDLKRVLAEAQAKDGDLAAQLTSKDSELIGVKAELADLKAKQAAQPKPPKVPAGWTPTATGAKITLASDILFAPGRATLSSQGLRKLRSIASTIRSNYPKAVARVSGFTDNDPIVRSAKLWKDNLELSANRAMAVTRQLRKLGISSESIETIAMGATHFVAPNTSRTSKAKNRRVEIAVVNP